MLLSVQVRRGHLGELMGSTSPSTVKQQDAKEASHFLFLEFDQAAAEKKLGAKDQCLGGKASDSMTAAILKRK